MKNHRHVAANLCLFGGGLLLALWSLYLLFLVFFWTGMGLRFGPPPPAGIYWREFLRVSAVIGSTAASKLWFITWPLVIAVGLGWHERRRQKRAKT